MADFNISSDRNRSSYRFSAAGVEVIGELDPRLAAANLWFSEQQWQAAESSYEQVFLADSACVSAGLQWARCALKQGHWLVACSRVTEVLRLHPTDYASWLEAGQLLAKLDRLAPALNAFLQAVRLEPQRYEAHFGLVLLFQKLGQKAVADNALKACLAVADGGLSVSEYQQLAEVRFKGGELRSAVDAIYAAIRVAEAAGQLSDKNKTAELMLNAGVILTALGGYKFAEKAFIQALLSDSESILLAVASKGVSNRGITYLALKRCIELFPNSAAAYYCLAHTELFNRRVDEALVYLDQAEALKPLPVAAELRIRAANNNGDQQAAHRFYLQQMEQKGSASGFRSKTCMTALYCDDLSATEVAELHQRLCADLAKAARPAGSFKRLLVAGRCLKLGIVTADFFANHPVCQFMLPILSRLNPAEFEVTVYFTGAQYDDLTMQAKARVLGWRDVQHLSESQLAGLIDDDQIDILLDLAGHTGDQRMGLFGKRAAPVQVSFLGYPASTGVPNMDWMLVDKVVAPIGSEALFSERLWRLPNTVFCFAPEQDFAYPRYGQKQAKRVLTFGSFNNVAKLTPLTISLWAKILHELPESQLLLKAPNFSSESGVKAITDRFAAEGIAANRLVLRGGVPLAEMMAEYADVDIALDTLPYNGGTTTLQAMWMGVPVVVKAGNNFVSRMGASFMQAAGLPEWVAVDDDDYVRIAVQMAQDRQALLKLKQGLRRKLLKKPAWDIDQYTRDFSAALQGIWQEFVGL